MIDLVKEFFSLTWKYWASLLLLSAAAQVAWYYLKEQRAYREQDGKLMVRHGRLGPWVNVADHMVSDHHKDG